MGRENTECDVSIALYKCTKQLAANIVFFNDTEILLNCERVLLSRDGNRLYFHNGDTVKDSIKISGRYHNILQTAAAYSKVRDMEGNYDLKYDKEKKLYYVNKEEKLSEYRHKESIAGCKHVIHRGTKREKREVSSMTVSITDKGKSVVERFKQEKRTISNQKESTVIVRALFNLLREQVSDNSDALATIKALEKYYHE